MPITSKHILISRTDNIGDIVLTLPMAARLKELNPGVKISMLCRRYAADVVRYCDDIDEVVEEESVGENLYGFLRASDIDTVILAQPNRDLAKAAFFARVKHRVGNARQKVYQLIYCNDRVRFSKGLSGNHESQINFEFLRPYGDSHIPAREEIANSYHFSIPVDAGIAAELAPHAFNLILHTKSNGHGREWPVERYTELARTLQQQPGLRIWLTGSTDEGKWLEQHAGALLTLPHVVNTCGSMSLARLTQFISQADGLIASGTGPLHLSAAIGQRTLGLFPPTRPMHPGRWAALGKRASNLCTDQPSCQGCEKLRIMTCDCMRAIGVQSVLEVVQGWIADRQATDRQ
ncbi:glycosyltransferase family 9 protein [Herbaspirillum sp. AP02]|uniref:glycosyltransferase family 9 protein n=1 Tax=unclassified Herbaspirillum TaxID=2624150 RepID=UPI0015DA9FC3|nr:MULTISPECIES: glycosyltransferase family 9 protein [unclassified Herbaspirillum]MBG7621083.1 glycosyltransferase family 9 protein [Herbaspirillum sp. AP02]NZD68812.1 glycosyltransferase family 9 protein [Herbaspirillum sp. AP21]